MIEARLEGRVIEPPSVEELHQWTAARGLLWLHVTERAPGDVEYLRDGLHLHPLVVEDIEHRNQRPKADEYGSTLFVVLFGATAKTPGDVQLSETHIILGDGWLATVTDSDIPALHALWQTCNRRPEIGANEPAMLFHRICDALVDSIFPVLDQVDDEIDRVENNIIQRADSSTVGDIFTLKRTLNALRRVLGPERDLFQVLAGPRTPRLGPDSQLYLRDVYDHAVRMVEQVDAYRDIVNGALDVYLSSVSNRLGEQTRRLTVIATIFLPLTFITGFFGMNFGVLIASISSARAFAVAVAAMVVSVIAVFVLSQRLTARVSPLPRSERARPRQ